VRAALDAFEVNLQRVRDLHAIRASFEGQVAPTVDLSDLLRAEVVLAVSALDHFVHELARLGMLECWSGTRACTDAFNRFNLPLSVSSAIQRGATAATVLDNEIRAKHGFQTFQHPDKIADAVRLFSDVRLWDAVSTQLGEEPRSVKGSLVLIVERRNKIAHEADIDPSYPGQRWPIDVSLVEGMFSRIDAIAHAIFAVSA
jgi:hypothetical protein